MYLGMFEYPEFSFLMLNSPDCFYCFILLITMYGIYVQSLRVKGEIVYRI